VEKVAYSAFYMTRMEWVLRKAGIDTLLVCGIVTNGGVASTVRDAHVRDFSTAVLSDGCAAFSRETHDRAIGDLSTVATTLTCAEALSRTGQALIMNGPAISPHAARPSRCIETDVSSSVRVPAGWSQALRARTAGQGRRGGTRRFAFGIYLDVVGLRARPRDHGPARRRDPKMTPRSALKRTFMAKSKGKSVRSWPGTGHAEIGPALDWLADAPRA
jgi:hypothetical protein